MQSSTSVALIAVTTAIVTLWYSSNTTPVNKKSTSIPHSIPLPPIPHSIPLQPIRIEPNGNCLFLSIAVAASYSTYQTILPYGSQERRQVAADLRRAANDLLCPNGEPTEEPFTADGLPASLLIEPLQMETPSEYCARLRKNGQWGSAAEIMAMSFYLGKPITVHTKKNNAYPVLQKFGINESQDKKDKEEEIADTLHILYTGSNHYSAMVRKRSQL